MNTTPLKSAVNSIKHWYIPLIIGLLLVLTGIYVFATPATSYLTLTVLFSLSFLMTGILQIAFSITNRDDLNSWGWWLAGGVLYALTGILLLSRPEISVVTLPFVVGFFVLFISASALGWAYDLKNMGIMRWGNIAVVGVLGMIFSFILLWNPLFAGLSLVVCTAMAFIFAGVASILLAIQLKKLKEIPGKISDELKGRINSLRKEYQDALSK
jgi:uncharacterized membrane protein HdeD (DUF308 family)